MSISPDTYRNAKIHVAEHDLLRWLAFELNEPHTRILGRLIRQEAERVKLEKSALWEELGPILSDMREGRHDPQSHEESPQADEPTRD